MDKLASLTGQSYSTADVVGIALFILFLLAMIGFLVWAVHAPSERDPIANAIRHPWSDDPDDLTAALNFERKQAAMGRAIRGERK